jgi:hypothetical protein
LKRERKRKGRILSGQSALKIGEKKSVPREAWPNYTGNRENATTSVLCGRFGIRKVPDNWDAIDITRAAAIHKEDFPAFIEGVLKDGSEPPSVKGFRRAFDVRRRPSAEAAE